MKNIKCIIFDCDGVLVDSESITNQVLIDMAKPFGLIMTLKEANSMFNGQKLSACMSMIEQRTGSQLPDNFESEFRRITFERFKVEMKAMPGVIDFINILNIPYCVASSGPLNKIQLNLTITGLADRFAGRMFSSYEINSWKPDPGIFLHAAKQMEFAVEDCVVIEDSIAGVTAAVRGGFRVYGYAHEGNEQELAKAGAIVFNDYEELAPMLFKHSTLS